MAARFRIIILDQPDGNPEEYNVVFWADVPAARQVYYANAATVSAWKDANGTDLSNLQSGAVVERVGRYHRTPGQSLAQIEASLQSLWTSYQAQINSYNPWQRYGSTWDGSTWVITNGA